ncbi:pyruvate dehydrogenase E2 component (dihydrolipoamide acetyltransferase) [Halogranum amylolyticum]|uniref:Pyruvate dehydrogenase E2 component (Dihydrolipoamide acetyltransferase) n=1 Tax=Halogranum amylolyticum TaxID=660520 RepID=A0A1H8PQK4_9EURY|nr:pyruvate dehydrogenase E2 component (dihydrolipoamide acetyltransferase) [Halogranum amylolyticum]
MGYIVKMPKLGMEMKSGTITKWVVDEGESVEKGDTLAEIESEKTAAEIEAREDGVLRRRYLDEGDATEPGGVLGIVAAADEEIAALEAEVGESGAVETEAEEPAQASTQAASSERSSSVTRRSDSGSSGDVKASPRARQRADDLDVDLVTVEGTGPQGSITEQDVVAAAEGVGDSVSTSDVRASPRAKKRAEDLGVDLTSVEGTGPQGSVTEEDVETAAESGEASGAAGRTTERPLSGMRRTIADRLGQSYREAVHVTEHRTADAEAVLAAADAASETFSADVSVTDVLLRALSAALTDHPEFNATFEDDVHRLHEDHNLCVAVDVEAGLIAPVVRNVGPDHVVDIAEKRAEVTERALSGDYTMDDLSGGTFTVTNLGVLGVESFDPVINPPQVAILGVNAISERPTRGDDGSVVFRRALPLDLSFDHRIVDGADAARFLDTLVDNLEDPWPLLEGVDRREATPVELPEGHVSASVDADFDGSISAGSFDYEFGVTEQFGGSGGAPTPVDFFLGSLAACLSSSIGVQANMRDVDFDDITVDVEATPPEGSVESLAVHVSVATDADDAIVDRIVTNGERTCHVAELLREDLPVEVTWDRG